jgi:RNA 2',3'-cyclic 3'-phosphodiesterase
VRLFVAAELSDEARAVIARGLGPLKRDLPPARWVCPEAIHVTLKFIGEQPPELVAPLDREAGSALAACDPVTIQLGGGGFFPHERRPRVAWVGGQALGLERWAAAVENAAAGLGVAREARAFSLHLTLARIERPWGAPAIEHFLVAVGKWQFPAVRVREAVLFVSELRPSGAVYTALARWPVTQRGETTDA